MGVTPANLGRRGVEPGSGSVDGLRERASICGIILTPRLKTVGGTVCRKVDLFGILPPLFAWYFGVLTLYVLGSC